MKIRSMAGAACAGARSKWSGRFAFSIRLRRHLTRPILAAGALALPFCLAPTAARAQEPARDWAALLAQDARNIHREILANHPGPVDPANPAFGAKLDKALARAVERSRQVKDFGGYWWALRELVASFDDGHVAIQQTEGVPRLPSRWPGFLSRYEDGRVVVRTVESGPNLPPVGAELIACDGRKTERLLAENVGRFRGLWFLESQRTVHGWRLFLDLNNPFVQALRACTFRSGTGKRTFTLNWRDLPPEEFQLRTRDVLPATTNVTGVAPWAGGTWISVASFGDEAALQRLVADLRGREEELGRAPAVVLDLRENGGGNSTWATEIARLVWGHVRPLPPTSVDWRVSPGNIERIGEYLQRFRGAPGTNPNMVRALEAISAGMKEAAAAGKPLWRQPRFESTPSPAPSIPRKGTVYVLTDSACASACLDAVDLWKFLGAVHVGRQTSADTVYMDIRSARLPSGLAELSFPMKVYRDRQRGHNEPVVPSHLFTGNMSDDEALKAWLARVHGTRQSPGAAPKRRPLVR